MPAFTVRLRPGTLTPDMAQWEVMRTATGRPYLRFQRLDLALEVAARKNHYVTCKGCVRCRTESGYPRSDFLCESGERAAVPVAAADAD
jgi:hypothetical protein